MTATIITPDGRTLAFAEYGDPAGRPVIVAHGIPGSRLQARLLDGPAREVGVRLIAPDRPGYGVSSPRADASFDTWSDDVELLLDHLHLERTALLAVSGGGGPALAAAQRLPARITQVLLVCAMVPGAPRSVTRGRPPSMELAFWLARRIPPAAAFALRRQRSAPPSESRRERALAKFPAADAHAMRDDRIRAASERDAKESLRQGVEAAVHELGAYARPLSRPLATITVPTTILHGSEDRNVPVDVARWAATQIPNAELRVLEGQGHLFAASDPMSVLEALT